MTDIVIIEDEMPAYKNLETFITKAGKNYRIIRWLNSVEQAVEWLEENQSPDLIFLDIQLSDGHAFDIFDKVTVQSPVIFSTAYDQYALKAFELNSVDYLLKPLSFEYVKKALEKYQQFHAGRVVDSASVNKAISELKQLKRSYTERFLVRSGDELISLPVDKIAWFYADKSTFCMTVEGRIFSLSGSLRQLETQLDPAQFFRLNRKVITNRKAIHQVKRHFGSKLNIQLEPAAEFKVLVSREKTSVFKRWFGV